MVKLFLVCFAVCMGATSEAVKVGTCSHKFENDVLLSEFSGQTYDLHGISKTSQEETTVQKATLHFLKIVADTVVADFQMLIGTALKTAKSQPQTRLTYTKKTDYLAYENDGPFGSGKSYNTKCTDGKILNEMCKDKGETGSNLMTVWGKRGEPVGDLKACQSLVPSIPLVAVPTAP